MFSIIGGFIVLQSKYDEILSRFKLYYPNMYSDTITWCASGPSSIVVKLKDGTAYEYNRIQDTIRRIRTETFNEEVASRELGQNLQKYIQLSGLTQTAIANRAGITTAMLTRYIKGTSTPSVIKARKLASILGCSVDELFDAEYV